MAKIMLVEDDNNLREIYGARLLAEGHEIVTAKDGEEALATAVKEKPDLIISDVMMPRISGFDMLDILRNAPETKFTKVIMMTALSQAEDKARADNLGADRYLVKSQVTLEDVARVVRDVLEGKTEDSPEPITPEVIQVEEPVSTETPGVSATTEPITTQVAAVEPEQSTENPAPAPASEATEPAVAPNPEVIPITEPAAPVTSPVADPVSTVQNDPLNPVSQIPEPVTQPPQPTTQAALADAVPADDSTASQVQDQVVAVPVADPVVDSPAVSSTAPTAPDPTSTSQPMPPISDQATPEVSEPAPVAEPTTTVAQPENPVVMPDPISVTTEPTTAQPEIVQPSEPAPTFNVQLPSQNQVTAVGAEPATLATPITSPSPTPSAGDLTPLSAESATPAAAEPFVGPNLAEALQAEEAAAEQGSLPSAQPATPAAADTTPLVGNITLPSTPEPAPAVEPQSAPVLPSTTTASPEEPAPAVEATPPATSQQTEAAQQPDTEREPAPAEEPAPNPLNDDTKKKLVIQPLHDLNSGPDLNALLEKEKALEAVMPPAATTVVTPQLVGNEIMPNPTPMSAPNSPVATKDHDSIAL